MKYSQSHSNDVPISLLLVADPCEKSIHSYLDSSWCFVAKNNNEIVAACVVKPMSTNMVELFNISVSEDFQQLGIGTKLLHYSLEQLKSKGVRRVELGTGTFGHQLSYYQRAGFRVDAVAKDHFLLNYPEPIFENGIQHKDMLRLYIDLNSLNG
ncbi:GNAT family N-acetyltransferase [uncultured Vibrio sp.]|uniref:GNAT family N-acetyltransferase n=1 Tax=uncultured Vibrio sp. TaxID=114054 RepID=UPI0025ECC695|nr:GNAT family N-acetyltransferase [uncultured Vibrio sp.]